MVDSCDFLNNAKSFGTTPSFYKVEVIRGEIVYIPDRENYPIYWKKKDDEEKEACKLKCSYKENTSLAIDYMKAQKIFHNLEEYSIMKNFPSESSMIVIEEEYFEISRSELIVLEAYYNITPFIYYQLAKSYPNRVHQNYTCDKMCYTTACKSNQGKKFLLLLRGYLDPEPRIIIPWQDFVAFLRERGFDIPQYTVPEY